VFRRYPFIRQNDQSDCGAAALAMIALYHRLPIGLQQMRELAGTDRIGTNLMGLLLAAEKLGFSARGVKGPFEALPSVPMPAIAHVKTEEGLGHFIVVYKVNKNSVVVADPAKGRETLSRDEFCKKWTGYLLLIVPQQKLPTVEVGGPPLSPWRRFLAMLTPHSAILLEAVFCALIMTLLGISTSYFVQILVDGVLVRHEGRLLNALGVGMVLILLVRTLFSVLREYLLAYVGRKVDLALISGYARHILGLPLKFFEMRRVGEILSRVNDASKVREAISGTTTTAVVDGVLVAVLVVVLWLYDAPLAIMATAFLPVLLFAIISHHPAAKRRSREAMEKSSGLAAHLVEDISGVETIKAFGAERLRSEEGEARLVGMIQSVFGLQKLGVSMNAVSMLVTAIAGLAVLWYGGHRVISGALSIGQLMFFYSLLGFLLGPLQSLSSVNLRIQDALVAVDRLFQIMELPVEPLHDRKKVKLEKVNEGMELHKVSFKYGCRANVLEDVSLRIPAGKTIAIVGESGSGKSTLLKLLMGYYEPTEGRLTIDGVDMRDYQMGTIRKNIGLVSQEAFVFNGTLGDNIALGRWKTTPEEVRAVCKAAGLEEYIAGLPERHETVIGERGANMSGGQRQRLAIARALLRQPEILIFDEATSHLDTATERAIQENLKTYLAGKTTVMVAHRLSTIKDADLIYVLHKGKIVEEGTHRQLMARMGKYAALWRAQTEGIPEPRLPVRSLESVGARRGNGRAVPTMLAGAPAKEATKETGKNTHLDLGDSLYCFSF
jgi:ATP-binding cassette subfamily B protein